MENKKIDPTRGLSLFKKEKSVLFGRKMEKKITKQMIQSMKKWYREGYSSTYVTKLILKNYQISLCSTTVRKYLYRSGISIRNLSKAFYLRRKLQYPVGKILFLYQKKKYGIRKISRLLHISNRDTLRKILRENGVSLRKDSEVQFLRRKHHRISFNEGNSLKAYMIGLVEGDLAAYQKSKYTIILATNSTHDTLIDLVRKVFQRYGNIHTHSAKNTLSGFSKYISATLDNSFEFLLPIFRRESIFKIKNKNEFLSFLAGLIDADGSVIVRKTGKYFQLVVRVFSQDLVLLKFIQKNLFKLGLEPNIHQTFKSGQKRIVNNVLMRYNRNYYTLELSNRPDVITLLKQLPLRHVEKISRTKLLFKIYQSNLVFHKDIEPELLRLRYKINQKVTNFIEINKKQLS